MPVSMIAMMTGALTAVSPMPTTSTVAALTAVSECTHLAQLVNVQRRSYMNL